MLKISVEHEESPQSVAVMKLEGELDAASYLDVIAKAREIVEQGARRLVLDLGELTYMGSSGLFALHSIAILLRGDEPPDPEDGWGAIHAAEGRPSDGAEGVKLLNPQPQVDRVLERSGMKRHFETYTDRAAAIGSFR